ncbi:hypothetical protein B0A48_15343 [Cryoendolithus antarcticus]|uniref:Uncharacterized protein n=1 Tax=Cryoendolithus antarcticus TaxID=1507870 RepID=A0A1V8SI17_9PEZI|nr:hypothetical protein B0A48_15343 [Cryoendolithus antarcticus]
MDSITLHSPPLPTIARLPAMVSEVHLDLTGIGERIALELKDALKELKLVDNTMPTADDIGKSVSRAMKKRLSEAKAQDAESKKTIEQLSGTNLLQNHMLSSLIDAIHNKNDLVIAAEELDDDSTTSEIDDDSGLGASSLRDMIMMHATLFWKLNHVGPAPEMHIMIRESSTGTTASVVYVEYTRSQACEGPCRSNDAWGFSMCKNHGKTTVRPAKVHLLDGQPSESDVYALRSLYGEAKRAVAQVPEGRSFPE